jgi:hypothetical protein
MGFSSFGPGGVLLGLGDEIKAVLSKSTLARVMEKKMEREKNGFMSVCL